VENLNLKIKVRNEKENKEVQSLFGSLGGEWVEHGKNNNDKKFLYLTDGDIQYDDTEEEFDKADVCKEITIPELL